MNLFDSNSILPYSFYVLECIQIIETLSGMALIRQSGESKTTGDDYDGNFVQSKSSIEDE